MNRLNHGYQTQSIRKCNGNRNGYVYALIPVEDDSEPILSHSEDTLFYVNEPNVAYIGITNNPLDRLRSHRKKCNKGKKIGMVIFNEAEHPAEATMLESTALYNYYTIKGKSPQLNKARYS
tara:strand:+ start:495 stop:857 length:363 start_codon:yes stop_codon:yes gene_type:complete